MPRVDASPAGLVDPDVRVEPDDRALDLHPQVALRRERFGALAYHYGNRRLVFLKDADLVRVVESLPAHPSLEAALDGCAIAPARRSAFRRAIANLVDSGMVRERPGH